MAVLGFVILRRMTVKTSTLGVGSTATPWGGSGSPVSTIGGLGASSLSGMKPKNLAPTTATTIRVMTMNSKLGPFLTFLPILANVIPPSTHNICGRNYHLFRCFSKLPQQFFQVLNGVIILLTAETADRFQSFALLNKLLQFFSAQGNQPTLEAFL